MKSIFCFSRYVFLFIGFAFTAQAQVINQYPLSPFGGTIQSVVGAVNSYNTYITSGDALTGALSSAPVAGLTQNQRSIDAALAQGINQHFNTVAYNTLTGTPLYVGNQAAINQLINAIDPTEGAYQSDLNQLGPGIYTTIPTMLFNSANLQNIQLQQRLGALRLSNNSLATEDKTIYLKKKVIEASSSAPFYEQITTFVDGNGMWSQTPSVNTLPSYKTYAGGVQAGASYHVKEGIDVGPYVGYQGTRATYSDNGGSTIVDNSVRYGLFGTYEHGGFYTDGIIGGAFNSVNVNRRIKFSNPNSDPFSQLGFGSGTSINETAVGNVSGGEFDSLLGSGYQFHFKKLKFGPAGSVQYSYLQLGSTQESGAGVEDLNVGAQNSSSLLTTLGGEVSYEWNLGSYLLQPYGSLAWQHEFLQNSYTFTSSILGQNFNYSTINPGRDQYIAGVGVNLIISKSISLFIVCNLVNGDSKTFTQSLFGGINYRF